MGGGGGGKKTLFPCWNGCPQRSQLWVIQEDPPRSCNHRLPKLPLCHNIRYSSSAKVHTVRTPRFCPEAEVGDIWIPNTGLARTQRVNKTLRTVPNSCHPRRCSLIKCKKNQSMVYSRERRHLLKQVSLFPYF